MTFLSITMGLLAGSIILFIVSPYFRSVITAIETNIRLDSHPPEDRYVYITVLFLKEMTLTSVYVLFAFLPKWFGLMNNNSPITSVNFQRWLIEGSLAPYLLGGILLEYYIGYSDTLFDQYQSFFIIGMILKIPLYLFMRCAESQANFFLNQFEYFLINKACQWLLK
jgi:hypothetical protein